MNLLCVLVFGTFPIVLLFSEVQSRSSGPPLDSGPNINNVCNQLVPQHPGTRKTGNGGYIIATNIPHSSSAGYNYRAGQTYTGKLNGMTVIL